MVLGRRLHGARLREARGEVAGRHLQDPEDTAAVALGIRAGLGSAFFFLGGGIFSFFLIFLLGDLVWHLRLPCLYHPT